METENITKNIIVRKSMLYRPFIKITINKKTRDKMYVKLITVKVVIFLIDFLLLLVFDKRR